MTRHGFLGQRLQQNKSRGHFTARQAVGTVGGWAGTARSARRLWSGARTRLGWPRRHPSPPGTAACRQTLSHQAQDPQELQQRNGCQTGYPLTCPRARGSVQARAPPRSTAQVDAAENGRGDRGQWKGGPAAHLASLGHLGACRALTRARGGAGAAPTGAAGQRLSAPEKGR